MNSNVDLPQVINQLRRDLSQEGNSRIKIPGTIFVTEIVNYYYPYQGEINEHQKIRGALYHQAIQSLLRIECVPEVSVEKEFEGWVIRGRIDMVCGEWLAEIKSSRSSQKRGTLQLQIYNWMLGGGRKLMLLYSDLSYEIVPPNPQVENLIRKYIKAKLF